MPQVVPSTSDHRLIELKNQVQCLMEAHLALTQPIQVNKVTTSYEICSGPYDTQYCMEDPKQAFVEYTSSCTDEAGGRGITRLVFGVKGFDLGEEEAPYWTTLGIKESYKLRPFSDRVGAQPPYYDRNDFLDCHLPREWEISRDAELNPFKDTLAFRGMVIFDEKK
nr:hypothetical protein [Tanacetum cinerariifolium]